MDADRVAAGLIAGGLVIAVIAGIVTPSGLYQEPDDSARLRIIAAAGPRFVAAQLLWSLMLVTPAAGFALVSRRLPADPTWISAFAGAAVLLGAAAGILFVLLQTVDPARFWLSGEATGLATAAAWLTVLAAALYGIGMLQAPAFGVAGFALLGYAVLAVGALLWGAPAFYVTAGFYLVALAPAITLWRS